jgi:hypothetical protein
MAVRCEKCGELIWVSPEETVRQKMFTCGLCGKSQVNHDFESIQTFINTDAGDEGWE